MTNSRAELVAETKNEIILALTAAIFFVTFLSNTLSATGATAAHNNGESLTWGIGVACYLVDYFLMHWLSAVTPEKWFRWIQGSIAIGVGSFAVQIVMIVASQHNGQVPEHWMWLFLWSLWGTLIMPIVTFLFILAGHYWAGLRSLYDLIVPRKRTPAQITEEFEVRRDY